MKQSKVQKLLKSQKKLLKRLKLLKSLKKQLKLLKNSQKVENAAKNTLKKLLKKKLKKLEKQQATQLHWTDLKLLLKKAQNQSLDRESNDEVKNTKKLQKKLKEILSIAYLTLLNLQPKQTQLNSTLQLKFTHDLVLIHDKLTKIFVQQLSCQTELVKM